MCASCRNPNTARAAASRQHTLGCCLSAAAHSPQHHIHTHGQCDVALPCVPYARCTCGLPCLSTLHAIFAHTLPRPSTFARVHRHTHPPASAMRHVHVHAEHMLLLTPGLCLLVFRGPVPCACTAPYLLPTWQPAIHACTRPYSRTTQALALLCFWLRTRCTIYCRVTISCNIAATQTRTSNSTNETPTGQALAPRGISPCIFQTTNSRSGLTKLRMWRVQR